MKHEIKIEALHKYAGSFDKSLIGADEMMDLTFVEETQIKYECVCGRKFRKRRTAVEHLHEVSE